MLSPSFYRSLVSRNEESIFVLNISEVPEDQVQGSRIDSSTGFKTDVVTTTHNMIGVIYKRATSDAVIQGRTTELLSVMFNLNDVTKNPDGEIPQHSDTFTFEGIDWDANDIKYTPSNGICQLILVSTEKA